MGFIPLTALALLIWHCAGQACSPQTGCSSCLAVKDSAGITICAWCRNSNTTSEGFCTDRTLAATQQCSGSFVQEGNTYQLLVTESSSCEITSNQNVMIAAIAGCLGGIIFAVVFVYIYYRKKKQKQERLAVFRRRELEMHRNRKLKLDKELGMQAGAASNNQRQIAAQQGRQQEVKAQEIEMEVLPPPEPALQQNRRRFKCMSKGGLRVRESPSSDSAKVGGIKYEVVVTALSVKGNWVQVSANGWAMMTSEDGSKLFLKELDEDLTPEEVVG